VNNNKVLLSLGSNLGDRQQNLLNVIKYLVNYNILQDIQLSNIYETEPVGEKNQGQFLNMCLSGFTNMSALNLINTLKNLEVELGRIDRGKWMEREIDIDILMYEDIELKEEKLELPHPRMHERKFVLFPANEIESQMIHPIFNVDISQLLKDCKDDSEIKIYKY
jgi:2-amino-4-hydroxy-6-hydroxymethyldihydropteridine diphosphokinase